jgi:hypothetical protein
MGKKDFTDLGPVGNFITRPEAGPVYQGNMPLPDAAPIPPAAEEAAHDQPIPPPPSLPVLAETPKPAEKPAEQKADRELKQKRLNLLIQPSLHENMVKIAYVKRLSINELICQVLREYQDRERQALFRYEQIIQG